MGELRNDPDEASNRERERSFGSNEFEISAEASKDAKSASEKEVYDRARSRPSSLSSGDSWVARVLVHRRRIAAQHTRSA